MEDITDVLLDFMECCVHTILYSRQIYPSHLFEQRLKYGMNVWQCRHTDICGYVRKVLNACQPLIEKRILDRIIFTTMTGNLNSVDSVAYIPNNKSASNQTVSSSAQQSKIIDQISLNCKINKLENISEEDLNNNYYYLESELRSTVLQLALLDVHMSQLPEDTLQALLLSSEWAVNNSLLPEEIARANDNNSNDNSNNCNNIDKNENGNNNSGIFRFPKSSYPDSSASQEQLQLQHQQVQKIKSPKILPLKSFRNELFDLNVVAHTF